MDEALLKKAQERTQQRIALRQQEAQKLNGLPKPRSLAEVSAERRAERELEAIAPSTGYPDLDQIVRGFVPGHLITLTGNTNVGKTTVACNFAIRVAKQGKKVLYLSLEPENMIIEYLASVRTDKTFEEVNDEDREFDDGNIHIFGKQEIPTLKAMIDVIDHLDRYDLVIIDHIGYFTTGDSQNFIQEQSNAVKKLVALAKRKQCCVLAIAHLRKMPPGKKRIITQDDISGSAAFKQDSTEVFIVVREVLNEETGELADNGLLMVTKTKAGPNGIVNLTFSPRKANITSIGEQIAKAREASVAPGWEPSDKLDEKW